MDTEDFKRHGQSAGESKRVAIALAHRKTGAHLQTIANHYGVIHGIEEWQPGGLRSIGWPE